MPGGQLGRLGQLSPAPAGVWASAGALAREIHAVPAPPWSGWDADDFARFVDGECRWLVDNEITSPAIVEAARTRVEPALRPFAMVFTHGDYQPAHILFEGETITGIIDWADACPGDALFDLAILTVGHQERLDDVVFGYGAPVDVDVIRGWWALRRLTSVRWMIEHGFNAEGDVASLEQTARS